METKNHCESVGCDGRDHCLCKCEDCIQARIDDKEIEVCPDCEGTGLVVEGEFDDFREKKCHCQDTSDTDDNSDDEV